MLYILGAAAVSGIAIIGAQWLIIKKATSKISFDGKPFERLLPQATKRILFIGDSTALGTGSSNNLETVAGYFGHDFPSAHIENKSANGKKLRELLNEFPSHQFLNYNLVVMQIGGNDILRFSNFSEIEDSITQLIIKAKTLSNEVVILHTGNVGLAPIFIWPFSSIMTHRAKMMRALYMRKASELGVIYIDLFRTKEKDPFLTNINTFYSPDGLHPSGAGYRWWYERIREALKSRNSEVDSILAAG
jgi:lysophospholipase L1-like esterase